MSDVERELSYALERARAIRARPIEARVHSARAELERARGDHEAQERELRAARALFKEVGARPLVDSVDRELATLAARAARTGANL